MVQLSPNVFAETGRRGSNHGFVTTSDGIVLIDGPHKPSDALRLKAEIEQDGMAPRVMRLNVASLYDYVLGAGIHGPGPRA
jgi:hypothetical protein